LALHTIDIPQTSPKTETSSDKLVEPSNESRTSKKVELPSPKLQPTTPQPDAQNLSPRARKQRGESRNIKAHPMKGKKSLLTEQMIVDFQELEKRMKELATIATAPQSKQGQKIDLLSDIENLQHTLQLQNASLSTTQEAITNSPRTKRLTQKEGIKSLLSKNDDNVKLVVRHSWSIHSSIKNAYISNGIPDLPLFIADTKQILDAMTTIKKSAIFIGGMERRNQGHYQKQQKTLEAANQSSHSVVLFRREARRFILTRKKQYQNIDPVTEMLKETALSLKNLLASVQEVLTLDTEQDFSVQNSNEKP